jgi:dCTP deaminase
VFLPYREIMAKGHRGLLISTNFEPSLVNQASYDLRLGEEIYVVGKKAPERMTDRNPYVSIQPGQFAILTTYEELKIPDNVLAFISVRTTFKIQGLVNVSGFHVDPSYEGKLLFVVQNVGPVDIRLKYRTASFSIFFSYLTSNKIGKKRDQDPSVHFRPKISGIRLQDVQLLGGSSVTLNKLQKDLDRIKLQILIYGPFAVAALIALLVQLFQSR